MARLNRPFTGVLNDLQTRLQERSEYNDLINLGLGNPGTKIDEELQRTLTQSLRNGDGTASYGSSTGAQPPKKAISEFLTQVRRTRYDFSKDKDFSQIAITPGITFTIQQYFTALYNQDIKTDEQANTHTHKRLHVLVPTPAYAWYFPALKNVGGVKVVEINTRDHEWKLDAKTLQGFLQQEPSPDALILNYPCNPTGENLTEHEWKEIAAVLKPYVASHPGFRIVVDNAYRDLQFGPPTGLLETAPELMDNIIEFNSVAKFHGFSGRNGPGFAVSQNTKDMDMLRKQLNPMLGLGPDYEAFLGAAFSKEYFTPERIEETLGRYRRRCHFVERYINEQLAPTEGTNHHIALPADGGMFVFADFSRWLGKKIDAREADKFRKLVGELAKDENERQYFSTELFSKNTINDDKDLSIYLMLKAHIVTIPGQDFSAEPKDGMIRFALGHIGDLTTYKQLEPSSGFDHYLHDEPDLKSKPLDDLRKLKAAMDKAVTVLKDLEKPRVFG